MEATASLDRKVPARRIYHRRVVMASDASDFAVASYSVEGLPEFTYSDALPLEHITLWWLTDNQNVEKFLSKGSGKVA
jgi:hypothetical protein